VSLSELPLASGQRHRKVFERKFGFACRKNGEHIILVSPTGQVISVPNHDEVKRPTLKQILRTCGIDDKDYRKAFDEL
jgi:predicted RNA binding protein YcfA (HicA-like mRNA interferase family)